MASAATLVDQKARDDARDAKAAITAHEQVCTERMFRIDQQAAATNAALQKLDSDVKGISGSVSDGVRRLHERLDGIASDVNTVKVNAATAQGQTASTLTGMSVRQAVVWGALALIATVIGSALLNQFMQRVMEGGGL